MHSHSNVVILFVFSLAVLCDTGIAGSSVWLITSGCWVVPMVCGMVSDAGSTGWYLSTVLSCSWRALCVALQKMVCIAPFYTLH